MKLVHLKHFLISHFWVTVIVTGLQIRLTVLQIRFTDAEHDLKCSDYLSGLDFELFVLVIIPFKCVISQDILGIQTNKAFNVWC